MLWWGKYDMKLETDGWTNPPRIAVFLASFRLLRLKSILKIMRQKTKWFVLLEVYLWDFEQSYTRFSCILMKASDNWLFTGNDVAISRQNLKISSTKWSDAPVNQTITITIEFFHTLFSRVWLDKMSKKNFGNSGIWVHDILITFQLL